MNKQSKHPYWVVDFLMEKRFRVQRHLLIWLYLIYTEVLCHQADDVYTGNIDEYRLIGKIMLFMAMVYFNMYVLVPKQLYKDKYLSYLISIAITIIGSLLLFDVTFGYFFNQYKLPNVPPTTLLDSLDSINMVGVGVLSSTSIKLLQKWKLNASRIYDLEKSALQVELRELKNQINPHFLFNMLNNVNVLTLKNPQKASLVVLKLSEFLRYQLYETSKHHVSLASEILFLEDFFALENIRRDDFYYSICNQIPDELMESKLPPNLFLIFVENAVKHSSDPDWPSSVDLKFFQNENKLEFQCINTKPKDPAYFSTNGLGLTNVTRRLKLIYGDDYNLIINDQVNKFEIKLSIPL